MVLGEKDWSWKACDPTALRSVRSDSSAAHFMLDGHYCCDVLCVVYVLVSAWGVDGMLLLSSFPFWPRQPTLFFLLLPLWVCVCMECETLCIREGIKKDDC